MTDKKVNLNREDTSKMMMQWSHDISCCSASLWLLLERMVSQDEIREHALITLVVQSLENVNIQINEFDRDSL